MLLICFKAIAILAYSILRLNSPIAFGMMQSVVCANIASSPTAVSCNAVLFAWAVCEENKESYKENFHGVIMPYKHALLLLKKNKQKNNTTQHIHASVQMNAAI